MSRTDNHIVQKQTIEVTFSHQHNAAALQEKVKRIYYEIVVPALDRLFSEVAKDNIIIRFDTVDLDLGHLRKDDLEKQLIEKIIPAIRNEIESRLRFDAKDSSNIHQISPGKSTINAFFYFLKKGYFPWWCGINDLLVLESEITANYPFTKDLAGELMRELMRLINSSHHSLSRLNFQFSESFKYFLVENVCSSNDMKNELADKLFLAYDKTKDDILKKTSAIDHRTTDSIYKKTDFYIDKPIKIIPVKDLQNIKEQKNKEIREQNNIPLQSPYSSNDNDITQSTRQARSNMNFEKERGLNIKKSGNSEQDEIPGAKLSDNILQKPEYAPKHSKENDLDEENIYLDLAGLVILHPFIPQFFGAFGFTRENKFISEDAMHNAVHLLGYIATREMTLQEQILLLPKLLCGIEFNESIKKEIIITPEQEKEVTELLSAIISYWGALKNTSPNGLRNMFLKRAGKLSPREGGWQLDIEKKTWDILLGKLPWGISVVKLPWMKQILYINW